MTALKDVHGKSRYRFLFFISRATLSSLKAVWWVWLWSERFKSRSKKTHTHKLHGQPVSLCPTDVCLPTRGQTHNVNTKGFPVFSGGHSGHSFFCTFSLLSVIVAFFSTVHPPILFPQAGAGPAWALNTSPVENPPSSSTVREL